MAENYTRGIQRIFYRAGRFAEGIIVTMDILDPLRNWMNGFEFEEVGKGSYSLDFNFDRVGTYYAILYEDGVKKTSQSFHIVDGVLDSTVYVGMGFKGPSVINTG